MSFPSLHLYRETENISVMYSEFLTYSKICIWGMCLYSTTRSAETVKCFHWLMY